MYPMKQRIEVIRIPKESSRAPFRLVEYAYYVSIFYGTFGSALGLSVAMLGAGMLVVLAAFCIMRLGSRAMSVYPPIAYPVSCAIFFIGLQVFVHDEPLMGEYVRSYVPWIAELIILQSLTLRRGFFHRFAFVALVIGVATLPYMQMWTSAPEYQRLALDKMSGVSGLSNPDDLSAWFGFCAIYFILVGIETRRGMVRIASWLIAIGCLYMLGLTVTRAPLFGVAIATVIALRRMLKRGFLPVLLLIILSWSIYESGLFGRIAALYAIRGMEETGRLLVWPLATKRFLSSPLTGVGLSKIATYVPGADHPFTPHNSFLFIALASGIIPLAFLVAYWIRAAKGAFRSTAQHRPDAPFQIPLLIYALLISLQLNTTFMTPWVTVTLTTAMAAGMSRQVRRVAMRRVGRGEIAEHSRRWGKATSGTARYLRYGRPRRS
jgi:O-antigen ligase